jgi:hypothetical protein
MSETLLEKLDRIEAKLKNIQSIKPPKPIDYSKGISILEGINKELSKKLLDITANYERLDKELTALKNKKPVEQVNYALEILLTNKKINKLNESLNKIKSTPEKTEVKKEVKYIDHSKELSLMNNEITSIRQSINKKQDFDIKSEVEKVVTIAYVTNLYRNK